MLQRALGDDDMLSARKLHLLAGLKVDGLDLRTRELEFYMTRYMTIGGL